MFKNKSYKIITKRRKSEAKYNKKVKHRKKNSSFWGIDTNKLQDVNDQQYSPKFKCRYSKHLLLNGSFKFILDKEEKAMKNESEYSDRYTDKRKERYSKNIKKFK